MFPQISRFQQSNRMNTYHLGKNYQIIRKSNTLHQQNQNTLPDLKANQSNNINSSNIIIPVKPMRLIDNNSRESLKIRFTKQVNAIQIGNLRQQKFLVTRNRIFTENPKFMDRIARLYKSIERITEYPASREKTISHRHNNSEQNERISEENYEIVQQKQRNYKEQMRLRNIQKQKYLNNNDIILKQRQNINRKKIFDEKETNEKLQNVNRKLFFDEIETTEKQKQLQTSILLNLDCPETKFDYGQNSFATKYFYKKHVQEQFKTSTTQDFYKKEYVQENASMIHQSDIQVKFQPYLQVIPKTERQKEEEQKIEATRKQILDQIIFYMTNINDQVYDEYLYAIALIGKYCFNIQFNDLGEDTMIKALELATKKYGEHSEKVEILKQQIIKLLTETEIQNVDRKVIKRPPWAN